MCFQIIPSYGVCGHNGESNPEMCFYDTQYCSQKKGEDCPNLRTRSEDHPNSECIDCIGSEAQGYDGPVEYFKHCFQSTTCDHEYDHMITDVDRDPREPDVVLVTPDHEICPSCKARGYSNNTDMRELSTTKTHIPEDFANLGRASTVPTFVPSIRPSTMTRIPPNASYHPGASRAPSGASQVPYTSRRPTEKPGYTTKAPTQYPVPSSSRPAHSQTNYSSLAPCMNASVKPSVRPTNSTQAPHTKLSLKPPQKSTKPMSPADYLARGAPRNVVASAFYDNADGADARANIIPQSTKPASASTARPSSFPSQAPRSIAPSRLPMEIPTRAPPADAPSLDLEELMSGMTMPPTQRPTTRPSSSARPSGSTHYPSQAQSSRHPGSSHTTYPTTQQPHATEVKGSGSTQRPSTSRPLAPPPPPPAVSVPRPSDDSRKGATQRPSTSRPQAASGKTELPGYKEMASGKSAYPSQPPPSFKTTAPAETKAKAKAKGAPKVSVVPEEDEDLYGA